MASSPTHSSSSVSAPSHGSPPSHGGEPKNPKKSKKKTKMYVTERGKKSIEVEVQNHETIEVIKKRIMEKHHIPLRHQHLLLSVTDSRRHDRGSIFDIDKFDDAKLAGTEQSSECTLILTEGDSGKALVMSGLSALKESDRQSDKDRYNKIGVFPICGKLMNASKNYGRIHSNKIVQNLMIILGIKPDDGYKEDKQDGGEEEEEEDGSCFSRLRYGSVMLMMDSDEDGSHIKGLIIHLFNQLWPSLLKSPNFLFDFATPILKATPRSSQKPQEHQEQPSYFYSSSEYEEWRAKNCNENSYDIKHYKGLGTSSEEEGRKYFLEMDNHIKAFAPITKADEEAITKAFGGSSKERKDWFMSIIGQKESSSSQPPQPQEDQDMLSSSPSSSDQDMLLNTTTTPSSSSSQGQTSRTYKDFIDTEYISFVKANLRRTIPSMVDGLKPSQRKLMFCSFKRNLVNELKVAHLIGYVAENASYHHGERNLALTIVKMAHNFVGGNNIPLFKPLGQFGTRNMGGKDHASERYIHTHLSSITPCIFNQLDNKSLAYRTEDGKMVEPEWYFPVIPMSLVNGCRGVGVGWSCQVHPYNPTDIIENIRRYMKGEDFKAMVPFYRGFTGKIYACPAEEGKEIKYYVDGVIEKKSDKVFEIKELPAREWTQNYKNFLKSLCRGKKRSKGKKSLRNSLLESFEETNHGRKGVGFTVTFREAPSEEDIMTKLRLRRIIETNQMFLHDEAKTTIVHFKTVEKIMAKFCNLRSSCYERRLGHMLNQIAMLRRTIFYIKMIRNDWTLLDISRTDLYLKLLEIFKKSVEDRKIFAIADSEESCAQYLMSLPMTAFMLDNLKTLESELTQEESYITSLTEDLEPEQEVWMKLWANDLKQVETEWEIILKKDGVSSASASASASAGAGAGTSRQEVQVVQVQEEDGDTSVSGRKRKGKDALEG